MSKIKDSISLTTQEMKDPISLTTREMQTAHLDEAHVGDIKGAWGIIRQDDLAPRKTWSA